MTIFEQMEKIKSDIESQRRTLAGCREAIVELEAWGLDTGDEMLEERRLLETLQGLSKSLTILETENQMKAHTVYTYEQLWGEFKKSVDYFLSKAPTRGLNFFVVYDIEDLVINGYFNRPVALPDPEGDPEDVIWTDESSELWPEGMTGHDFTMFYY